MSYLEMQAAPLPNMSKGIISLWFRDARKNAAPAPQEWPSGVWTTGTTSMVPPDVPKVVTQAAYKQNVFYWNSYGRNISALGVPLPIFQGAAVMMPSPPPFVTNGMHMMLTFGNPDQTYDYCTWTVKLPEVIEGVVYVPAILTGPQWSVPNTPPPYAPYIAKFGKFKPATFVLEAPTPKPDIVPQSFIGVDKDGYLTICLQTNTKAKYKGYAFQLDKITEIRATATYYDSPIPISPGSGHWVKVSGYWDGYEFGYKDISNEVMGAQPEMFVIGGQPGAFDFATIPTVHDGAWHHLLFSFDIAGSVESTITAGAPGTGSIVAARTACKAWLALDDKNYDGVALQHRFPIHDGFQLPLLPGMGTDALGFGPVTTATRRGVGLTGDNDILPRNCWIIPFRGIPKDGLQWFSSTAGLWNEESTALINKGDYNYFVWTGNIWPLYGVTGDTNWRGELKPKKPSTPDPRTFDSPTYQCDGFSIPVANYPIGVPVSAHHLKYNTGIEMAELQIWCNKTLDTSEESNRRLFIYEKKDSQGRVLGRFPTLPSKAAKVLGKPNVLLHGSGNWQKGKNTGSSGVDDKDKPKAAGQFKPVAKIEKFKPEPQLGK